MRYQLNHKRNQNKARQITSESLRCNLSVCFLYNILALISRVKGNQPQKVTLMNHDIIQ